MKSKEKTSTEVEMIYQNMEELKKLLTWNQSRLEQMRAVYATSPWNAEFHGEILETEKNITVIKLKISALEEELKGKRREYR